MVATNTTGHLNSFIYFSFPILILPLALVHLLEPPVQWWFERHRYNCLIPNLRKLSPARTLPAADVWLITIIREMVFPSSPSLLNKTFPPRMGAEFYYMLFLHPLKWHKFFRFPLLMWWNAWTDIWTSHQLCIPK